MCLNGKLLGPLCEKRHDTVMVKDNTLLQLLTCTSQLLHLWAAFSLAVKVLINLYCPLTGSYIILYICIVIAEYTFIWYEALNWRFSLIRICTYLLLIYINWRRYRARVDYESEKFAEVVYLCMQFRLQWKWKVFVHYNNSEIHSKACNFSLFQINSFLELHCQFQLVK